MPTDEEITNGLKAALDQKAIAEARELSAMKARVLSRVSVSTGMASLAETSSAQTSATSRVLTSLAGKAALLVVLAGVGAGAYALRTHRTEDAAPPASQTSRATESALPKVAPSPIESAPGIDIHALPSVTEPKPPPESARRAVKAPPADPSAVDEDALLAEGAAIERARRAIRAGDGAAALAALDEHAKTFPRGQLAEERDSLRVRVLVMQGRREDARAAAEAFRRAYPSSLFQPIVAKAMESLP